MKALTADGLTPRQIADQTGITLPHVQALLASSHKSSGRRAIWLLASTIGKLDAPAKKRGLSASQLAERLLECAVDHKLIEAILDDSGSA